MTTLHERDVVALLLVRAVEEHDPSFFTPETLSESALSALDARTDLELLEKRTSFLFLSLPKAMRAWARIALLPEDSLGLVVLVAFLIGALSNYLGPSGRVHVAYNPLAFLIVWNLGVYTLLGWRRFSSRSSVPPVSPSSSPTVAPPQDDNRVADHEEQTGRGGLLRLLVPSLWFGWNRWTARLRSAGLKIKNSGAIATAFWDSYWDAARSVVIARVEGLIHVGAMGLLLGALLGTYVRGMFFDYNAVWRSTFLTEPASVATFLNLLLGPACLITSGTLLTPDVVRPLLLPEGAAAAAWIHRLALMGVLVVLFPRAILAGLATRHAKSAAARIEIDLSQDYFAERIRAAREGQIHRLRDGIATTMRLEVGKFAESVALFVRDQFFDRIVAPTLFRFRNSGGRISDLEAELSEHQARFEPELLEHLRSSQIAFQESVRTGVQAIVGKELAPTSNLFAEVSAGSVPMNQNLTDSVATNVGDAVGATATVAVTAAVATISGGIGKALGVAILSSLLGTSGPVGLLIGGVAAAAAVGGTFVLGRDRVTSMVKRWRIPATVVAIALRDSKLEQAREATYSQVKQDIESRIEPRLPETTELILQELSFAVVGKAPLPLPR
jgi:hypothetical protein